MNIKLLKLWASYGSISTCEMNLVCLFQFEAFVIQDLHTI